MKDPAFFAGFSARQVLPTLAGHKTLCTSVFIDRNSEMTIQNLVTNSPNYDVEDMPLTPR
jgi:hypothetical protein